MTRRIFLICCALFFLTFCGADLSAAQSTSPDGLQLSDFQVSPTQANIGDTVTVSFVLTNTSGHPIVISPEFGVFVGARWNSTSDANNRDFGHKDKGRKLRPGSRIVFKATRQLDATGVWRFWPAYNVNGHWGPFRWNEVVVQVAQTAAVPPPPPTVVDSSGALGTSPDGLQLSSFEVSPTQARVGDSVTVAFVLTNTSGHPIVISPEFGVFVGARWNSTSDANNRDFGHTDKGKKLSPGSRIVFRATRQLDAAGVWRFWPAYNVNGHWGPFRWHEIVVRATDSAVVPAVPPPPSHPSTGGSHAQNISRDGLQLTNFSVTPTQVQAGDKVTVTFTLTNTTSHPITISREYGIFVGARVNSTSDANNRDFGHRDKGRVLQPGHAMTMNATKKLDEAGTWRFWPAYNVNGHWGPFRWNEIVVEATGATSDQQPQKPHRRGHRY